MDNPSKKPFKDKSFFLDLKFYRHQKELVQNLKKLGAKVESFLSRDVSCVVTDKEDYKPRLETWTPATPKSFFSPSSSLNRTLSPFDTPSNTSSTANESKTTVLPRGLALVQKAKQLNKGTTDLYEVCNQWNIKIIHLQKLLGFIAKCKINTPKICNENQPPQRKPVQFGANFQKLNSPFIKVEDSRGKYRPHYKQFQSLKELSDRKLYKIVQSLQSDVLKPNVLTPLNVAQMSNMLVSPSLNNSVTPSFGTRCTRTVSIDKSQLQKSSRNQPSKPPANCKAKNENHNSRIALAKKKVSLKRKYCEICRCTFVSIAEHLRTDRHKRFMNDRRNFRSIERIIIQLPTVSDFLRKNMASEGVESFSSNVLLGETVPGSAATSNEPLDLAVQIVNTENIVPLENPQEVVVAASCPSDHLSPEFPYLNIALNCNDVIAKSEHSEEIQLDTHNTTPATFNGHNQHNMLLDEANNCWPNAIENCLKDHKNQFIDDIHPFDAQNEQDPPELSVIDNIHPFDAQNENDPPELTIIDNIHPFDAQSEHGPPDLTFGQAHNVLEDQQYAQGHKSPHDDTAQNGHRSPHLSLEEAKKCWQDALKTLECFKRDKYPVNDVLVPLGAQDSMNSSVGINNTLTKGKAQNVASVTLQSHEVFSPYNNAIDYKCDTGKNLRFLKDHPSINALESNAGVIRKFPFTNFGFGWNTPFCNDPPYPQNENISSCTNCSGRFTDSEDDMEENISNGAEDHVENALDLSVVKPAVCASLSYLLDSVEGGIAVT